MISKIKLYGLLLLMLLLITTAYAKTNEEICNDIKSKEFIGSELPSFIPYSNEVMYIYLNNEPLGTLTIEDSKIKSIECSLNGEATYNVYVKNEQVINELFDKGDLDLLNEYMGNGNIDISGVTTTKKIKLFFTGMLLKISSWFM